MIVTYLVSIVFFVVGGVFVGAAKAIILMERYKKKAMVREIDIIDENLRNGRIGDEEAQKQVDKLVQKLRGGV